MMDYAFQNGITSFDTAAVYGGGASEEIVGKWLQQNPTKSVQVATKIIPPFDEANIKTNITRSLNRLQIPCVDILYLHRWDQELDSLAPWKALEMLANDRKIKEIGVSNFNLEQLNNAINLLKSYTTLTISYLQNNHNLAVSDLNSELIELCQNNGIKIVTFSPLGAGFLTGKHRKGIATGSRFDLMPAHQAIYFNNEAEKRLTNLLQVAESNDQDPALLALAWAIHQPQTHQVLVGGRSAEQLDLAIAAAKFDEKGVLGLLERG